MDTPPVRVTAEEIEAAELDERDTPRLRDLLTNSTVFDAKCVHARRVDQLAADAYVLREAAGEVLATSGFKDRLDHKDLAVLRRAVREYDSSPAT